MEEEDEEVATTKTKTVKEDDSIAQGVDIAVTNKESTEVLPKVPKGKKKDWAAFRGELTRWPPNVQRAIWLLTHFSRPPFAMIS